MFKENFNKRIIKIAIMIIIIIIFIIIYSYKMSIIKRIGNKLVNTYSSNNVQYEYKNIGKNTESSIRKKLGKKIYYEIVVGDETITKQTYYGDSENDVFYYVPENEKILIPDNRAMLLGQMDTRMPKTRAEVYCYQVYLGNKIYANQAYNFKTIKTKVIENIECYEITMKYDSYLEKTYFNKNTLLPIKTIKENLNNNNILEWDIIVIEGNITEEEVSIPEGYTEMNLDEYYDYIRQKEINENS